MHFMFFPLTHVFFRNNLFSFQVFGDFPLSVNGFSFDSIMCREHSLGLPIFKTCGGLFHGPGYGRSWYVFHGHLEKNVYCHWVTCSKWIISCCFMVLWNSKPLLIFWLGLAFVEKGLLKAPLHCSFVYCPFQCYQLSLPTFCSSMVRCRYI